MVELPSPREGALIAGVALGVYVVLLGAAHILRRSLRLRFGWSYHAFAFVVGVVAGIQFSGWNSSLASDVLRHATALAIILAAFPTVALLNRLMWVRRDLADQRGQAPRMLADVTGFVVVLMAFLFVLQFIYDVKVPGLVAGSGVIAIVLGLAMQDLLGNLMAGISLYFEKSFQTGDWLMVEGMHAKVIETSWRSTRLLTTDDVLIDVPNGNLVKGTITNFEKPTPRHAIRATIGLHYDVPPVQVEQVLKETVSSVPGVCPEPAPVVYVKDFADSSIVYEIKLWIDDHAHMARVLSEVRSHCWYAVRRAGMEIPYPQLTIHQAAASDGGAAARTFAANTLGAHAIFSFLSREQIDGLVRAGRIVLFASHESVITQGATGDSMFLLARGRVDVRIARDGTTTTVAQLGAGDCFGEMSLLTGDPRNASVVASGEVEAVEIGKEAFATLIRQNPDVIGRLGELLAQRQLANERLSDGATQSARVEQARAGMVRKLRSFFQLGA